LGFGPKGIYLDALPFLFQKSIQHKYFFIISYFFMSYTEESMASCAQDLASDGGVQEETKS